MSHRTPAPVAPRSALIDTRLRPRRGWRDGLVACLAVAGLVAVAWTFQTQVERWFLRATFRAMGDEEPKRLDDRLVGRWISASGSRILISRAGVVWAEAGDLMGTGSFEADRPSRFAFEGPGFRCLYDLAVKRDVSDWQLRDATPAAACPEGRFVRAFGF